MTNSITVIGAGIAGASCAFDLVRAGLDVRVLEAGPRAGGVMQTVRQDGFQFEDGPNSVPSSARHFLTLCEDLGLEGEWLRSRPEARTRFLSYRGRLVPLPMGPGELLRTPLLSLGSKLKILTEPWRRWRPDPGEPDPPFDRFVTERFGLQAARRLGGSFVRGIYASDASELGTASAFPRLWSMVHESGGVMRGMGKRKRAAAADPSPAQRIGAGALDLVGLKRGFGSVCDALAERLGERLELGVHVSSMSRASDTWRAKTDGDAVDATSDHVVLATPAGVTGRLLAEAGLAAPELTEVTHASVCVVSLGFGDDFLPGGFGFLVPPDENPQRSAPRALGILFISKMFEGRAPEGGCGLSAIYRSADTAGMQEEELAQIVVEDLRAVLPGTDVPRPTTVHTRRWEDAIPRYRPGHRARIDGFLERMRADAPGLHFIGNWTGGVSIDDRVRTARECAGELIQSVRETTQEAAR